jgi:NAD(P)H-dependent FMN reductase
MANTKVLGIAGSLRKASFNRMALKATQRLVPVGATLEILDLPDLPGFNQDNASARQTEAALPRDRNCTAQSLRCNAPHFLRPPQATT